MSGNTGFVCPGNGGRCGYLLIQTRIGGYGIVVNGEDQVTATRSHSGRGLQALKKPSLGFVCAHRS
ncbi:hypothetical protein EMIT0196MI5_210017 [Pseudomonas sp. IT-196MI5]